MRGPVREFLISWPPCGEAGEEGWGRRGVGQPAKIWVLFIVCPHIFFSFKNILETYSKFRKGLKNTPFHPNFMDKRSSPPYPWFQTL